jgi:hypothetical protein
LREGRRATALCLALALAASVAAHAASVQERLGHPASARLLVIHADDLGMSQSVNRATFEALQNGWVTSASILVPCPWFPEVARFVQAHPDADLGIHLALNSEWTPFRWGPLLGAGQVPSLIDEQGYFPLLETSVAQRARPEEVERELIAQIAHARRAGIRISHLDSHMGALFQTAELLEVYRRLGRELDLPVLLEREGERGGERAPWSSGAAREALLDRVVSIAPGVPGSEWLAAYQRLLAPLGPGVYQLIVHLGFDDAELRGATADHPDWGAAWRQADYDLVRSPAFRGFLREQGFELVDWSDLDRARRAGR